jgi:hypothetical protein
MAPDAAEGRPDSRDLGPRTGYRSAMRRALLVAVLLVSVASCGSGGTSSELTPAPSIGPAGSTPAGSPSRDRAAFVASVNAACRVYADRDERIESPEELDDYVPFMHLFIDNSADLDAKLAELDPPPDVQDFDRYVAGNKRQTAVLRAALPKVEAAVRDSDQAEADAAVDDAIDAFNKIVDELDPYARRYGLDDCTSEPDE